MAERGGLTISIQHVGGCNSLCHDDVHYLFGDGSGEAAAPLGDQWVEVGYIDEGQSIGRSREGFSGPGKRPGPYEDH